VTLSSGMAPRHATTSHGKLKSFLSDHKKSSRREYVLTSRLVSDLTVAAEERGYSLSVYFPAVDSDGFDVILDDGFRVVPIQLKSVVKGGKASKWSVHKSLLRPKWEAADLYGFDMSPNGVGRAGGVILTTVEWSGEAAINVAYAYTDIDVLSAFWLKAIPPNPQAKKLLLGLRRRLQTTSGERIELSRSAFLRAQTPEHLLALMGLQSRFEQPWRLQLQALLSELHPRRAPSAASQPIPRKTRLANIQRYLQELSGK